MSIAKGLPFDIIIIIASYSDDNSWITIDEKLHFNITPRLIIIPVALKEWVMPKPKPTNYYSNNSSITLYGKHFKYIIKYHLDTKLNYFFIERDKLYWKYKGKGCGVPSHKRLVIERFKIF